MTTSDITHLLDRYYAAQTSPEEEAALRRYFLDADVPREREADRLMLTATATPPEVPADMEARLSHSIDTWNMVEHQTSRKARRISMRWIAGVAASMLAIVTLGIYVGERGDTGRPYAGSGAETFDNPDDAAGEAARALTKFSVAINKGMGVIGDGETGEKQKQ